MEKMFLVLFLCFFTFVNTHLQQITFPVYVPPTQDVILKKYFQPSSKEFNVTVHSEEGNVTAKNITKSRRDIESNKNRTDSNVTNPPTAVSDIVWTGLLKNLLRNSYETTTYKYPTATWTAEKHEKLKEYRKNQVRKIPKVFIMKPSILLKPILGEEKYQRPSTTAKPKRGKVKWKDSRKKLTTDPVYRGLGKGDVDKFLEQSLFRYLVSSNLIDNIGNVSVETFSEILRNITKEKADKRQIWPYDENKELRIKFRDEVFLKRKPEVPSRAKFLEKQFQKRLERMKDYLSRKDKLWKSKNGLEVPEKKTATTEMMTTFATTAIPSTETEPLTVWTPMNITKPSVDIEESQTINLNSTEASTSKPDFEELKLSVAETVYYKKRPFTVKSYSYEEEETGVIPGIPEIDYPMYSLPPSTGFKCPKGIGEQPRMMADIQTRCQVFYICTRDGPAAAMLCPNGTMFNENVRVCDWWYNVDC